MREHKQTVRGKYIYDELKRRIINLEVPVGNQLVEEAIAEEFSTSRTPVRQALQQLAAENFVTIVPYVGCTVRQLTVGDIDEIYTIRAALEGICVYRATSVISDENLAAIEEDVENDLRESQQNEQTEPNRRELLHHVTMEVGGNSRISQIMENLNDQLHWCHNFSMKVPGRFRKSSLEHREILRAMQARDPELAEKLMRAHLLGTQQDVTKAFLNSRVVHPK